MEIAKEYDDLKKKTFIVRENDKKVQRHLKKAIFTYLHLENMINLLVESEYIKIKLNSKENIIKDKSDVWAIYNLLLDKTIMKAVLSNNTGGEATKDRISILNDYFKENKLFIASKKLNKDINAHNISMIINRLNTNWKNYFLNKSSWFSLGKASGLISCPSYPKPKKLSRTNRYSVPIEPQNFSLKHKNMLGLNIFRKQIKTKFTKNKYVDSKNIESLTVGYKNGSFYYNFGYDVPLKEVEKIIKWKENKPKKEKKAGLDIGVINLASILVHDEKTQSLIVSGGELMAHNSHYNKLFSKLQKSIENEVISFETKKDKKGIERKINKKYTNRGRNLQKKKSGLMESRNRYFDDQMNKYSTLILKYLKLHKVTDLVISKNLSFTKTTGEIKMVKKTKQKFYQIPFGKFLNMLVEKSPKYGILVQDKNEAYTSKTSCISANVNDNQEKRSFNESILPTDLNGSRGSKGRKLSRGLFKDRIKNVIINSDLNGAANHIRLAFPLVRITNLKSYLWKLQSPKKTKSAFELSNFLKLLISQCDT